MNDTGVHLFFVYEPEHIPLVRARLSAGEKFDIVALEYETELDLKKNGIPFISVQDLAVSPEGEREPLEYTRKLTRAWYTSPEFAFFNYDGILLGEQHAVLMLYHLQWLLYYLVMIEQVCSNIKGIVQISIPQSSQILSITADPIAVYKEHLPVDVARLIAERNGISFEVVSSSLSHLVRYRLHNFLVGMNQRAFHLVTILSNILVEILIRPRQVSILVTDPWSRLKPLMKYMPDAEFVMTRRKEMKIMKWDIWKARARFNHRLDFADRKVRTLAHHTAEGFSLAWDALGETPSISKLFVYKGISFWSVIQPVLENIVKKDSEDAVATIESTKKLLNRYRINCVLLFTSTKGYNNLIARVAENMNIPSIELQHSTEAVEPSTVHSCLPARYLAAYGNLTRTHYENFGVEKWRLESVGSARFDSYAFPIAEGRIEAMRKKLRLDEQCLNVVVIVPIAPSISPLEFPSFTAYAAETVLQAIAGLQENNQKLRLILRLRPGGPIDGLYRHEETFKLFKGETRVSQNEDLRVLLAVCDFVIVCTSSTVIIEALLMHKPIIAYMPRRIDNDLKEYEDAGAVLIARTPEELSQHATFLSDSHNREKAIKRADDFLKENFKFDGKSAERVSALIRRVTSTML